MQLPSLPIVTDRLVLRPFTDADLDRFHSYRSLPETARYLYRGPLTREQAAELVDRAVRLEFDKDGDVFSLAIQAKPVAGPVVQTTKLRNTELLGEVLLKLESSGSGQAELGYSVHPDSAGRGYVTEAATALLDYGFRELHLHRIFARIDAEHSASAAVARRLGMRLEGHLIENEFYGGRWGSELVFALLASEWSARTAK